MEPQIEYPGLENLKNIKEYQEEFNNLTICKNSNEVKFDYDGHIVESSNYNKDMKILNWYLNKTEEKNGNKRISTILYKNEGDNLSLSEQQQQKYFCRGVFYSDVYADKKRINLLEAFAKNIDFFNFKTLIFMIKINGYNVNKNIFINVNLIFEQTDVGKIITSYKVCTLNVLSDLSDLTHIYKLDIFSLIKVLVFLFLCGYTIYSIYDLFMEAVENVKQSDFRRGAFRFGKSFKDIWFYFKMIQTLLFFMTLSLRIYLYVNLIPIFKSIKYNNETTQKEGHRYLEIENKCQLLETVTLMETFIICCTLLYFLRYLERNIIKPVSDTIIESYLQIIVFFTSYILVIFGFSFFCHYIFGIKEQSKIFFNFIFLFFYLFYFIFVGFRSPVKSVIQIFFMIFGDYDILTSMMEFFPLLTLIFIIIFGVNVKNTNFSFVYFCLFLV